MGTKQHQSCMPLQYKTYICSAYYLSTSCMYDSFLTWRTRRYTNSIWNGYGCPLSWGCKLYGAYGALGCGSDAGSPAT